MADTPDVSTIVNMILENPSLVAQIAAMAKGADGEASSAPSEKDEDVAVPTVGPARDPRAERRLHRSQLASAMKPYLSKERAQAIDTMMSIADILELTRGKS